MLKYSKSTYLRIIDIVDAFVHEHSYESNLQTRYYIEDENIA